MPIPILPPGVVTITTTTSRTGGTGWPTATVSDSVTNLHNIWIIQNQIMFTPFTSDPYYHSIPNSTTIATNQTSPYYSNSYSAAEIVRPLPPEWRGRQPAPPPPLARPAILSGRRALRRSIDLFRRLRPEAEIKTFLDGKPLLIHGHRFTYKVQKKDDLLRHTMNPNSAHIPYRLHLLHRQTGRALAQGCIVIPSTPVIDQLLALILHVRDVDGECDVLRTTNWTPSLSPSDWQEAETNRRALPLAA